jgi:hypothetical protein
MRTPTRLLVTRRVALAKKVAAKLREKRVDNPKAIRLAENLEAGARYLEKDGSRSFGMSEMSEAPSNQRPVNQAALKWLQEARADIDPDVNYLASLASWGFEKDQVRLPEPMSPSQPGRHDVENAVNGLLGAGEKAVAFATDWFLSNPNLERDEQEDSLRLKLEQAESPRDASQIVVETAYDLMVAESATFQE